MELEKGLNELYMEGLKNRKTVPEKGNKIRAVKNVEELKKLKDMNGKDDMIVVVMPSSKESRKQIIDKLKGVYE